MSFTSQTVNSKPWNKFGPAGNSKALSLNKVGKDYTNLVLTKTNLSYHLSPLFSYLPIQSKVKLKKIILQMECCLEITKRKLKIPLRYMRMLIMTWNEHLPYLIELKYCILHLMTIVVNQ